ncbi:MAG: hypothetical protein SGILL_000895 [Bacillariaceae sp.]
MGKEKKKRKIDKLKFLDNTLANLTGFGDGATDSNMDDCMAEMMQQQQQQQPSTQNASEKKPVEAGSSLAGKNQQPSWMRQNSCLSPAEIDAWNRSFVAWASGGGSGSSSYPPGLLPNLDVELARNFKVKEISIFLLKRFPGRDLRMPVFERWLLDSKLEEQNHSSKTPSGVSDPVLPLHASPESEASQRLLTEILTGGSGNTDRNGDNGPARQDVEEAIAELCRKTNVSCQELLAQRERYRRQSPLKKGDRIQIETSKDGDDNSKDLVTLLYSRKKWKKPFIFRVNKKHYKNLKDRFVDIHENTKKANPATSSSWPPKALCPNGNSSVKMVERSFHVIVLALLLRYSAMSGGQLLEDLRGGGMQGAIHSSVFQVLQSHLGTGHEPWLEGFASPFNATLAHFASAFPDLDWHFGSVGNFFDCSFQSSGSEYCEVNPPFTPGLMKAMSDHIFRVLARAADSDRALSFVVVVPSASEADKTTSAMKGDTEAAVKHAAGRSFRDMISNNLCTKHTRLKAREHGYIEGAQHLRPTQYKQSSYDTSIIVLQSPKAALQFSDNEKKTALESELRQAFASRHEIELKKRKAVFS